MSENGRLSIAEVNEMDRDAFTSAFADVFEHSPWVAERAWANRPFASVERLLEALAAVVSTAGRERQLELIRLHPDLAGKAALRGELTAHSNTEQASAGLDQCSPAELARLQQLNDEYKARFGFPFIMAVKGCDRETIIASFAARLDREPAEEFARNLAEINKIARLRLADLLRE